MKRNSSTGGHRGKSDDQSQPLKLQISGGTGILLSINDLATIMRPPWKRRILEHYTGSWQIRCEGGSLEYQCQLKSKRLRFLPFVLRNAVGNCHSAQRDRRFERLGTGLLRNAQVSRTGCLELKSPGRISGKYTVV